MFSDSIEKIRAKQSAKKAHAIQKEQKFRPLVAPMRVEFHKTQLRRVLDKYRDSKKKVHAHGEVIQHLLDCNRR